MKTMMVNLKKELNICSCCRGRCSWRKIKSHIPGRQLMKLYVITFLNLLAQSFVIIMLFPFLPFMVEFLVPGISPTAVGRYAGVIGGALFMGRVLGSYAWGKVADKWGRKPVIVYSNIFMALCMIAFGFSVNVAMAVIIRLLTGVFGGTITACKAVISDISDDKFQAFGLSIIGAAWSLGFVIGPAVSGAIADPVGQYNLTISNSFLHGYLTRFPYSLPCLVSTLLLVISTLLTVFCLPETLGKQKNVKRSEINQKELNYFQSKLDGNEAEESDRNDSDEAQDYDGNNDRTRLLEEEGEEEASSQATLLSTENVLISNPIESLKDGDESRQNGIVRTRALVTNNGNGAVGVVADREEEVELRSITMGANGSESTVEGARKSKWQSWQTTIMSSFRNFFGDLAFFMCHKITLLPLLLYMVSSFAIIGYNEIFSVWAYIQPHYGGLGFSLHEIGIVMTLAGVLELPSNLFTFAILERYLKSSIKVFYIGVTVMIFFTPLLPHLHYLVSVKPSIILWVLLVIVAFLLNSCESLLFSAIFMFINNSVTFDKLGAINGLSMTLTSLIRSVSPVMCGLIFSFTLSDKTLQIGFPLDYNFVFVILSLTFLASVFIVAFLPESINRQKIIEDE